MSIQWIFLSLPLLCWLVSAQIPPPNYSPEELPFTGFTCADKVVGGYYADVDAQCQMFHVCVQGPYDLQDFRFLCPNDTVFDQEHLVCTSWTDVDCDSSGLYFSRAWELFKVGVEERELGPRPTKNENNVLSEQRGGNSNTLDIRGGEVVEESVYRNRGFDLSPSSTTTTTTRSPLLRSSRFRVRPTIPPVTTTVRPITTLPPVTFASNKPQRYGARRRVLVRRPARPSSTYPPTTTQQSPTTTETETPVTTYTPFVNEIVQRPRQFAKQRFYFTTSSPTFQPTTTTEYVTIPPRRTTTEYVTVAPRRTTTEYVTVIPRRTTTTTTSPPVTTYRPSLLRPVSRFSARIPETPRVTTYRPPLPRDLVLSSASSSPPQSPTTAPPPTGTAPPPNSDYDYSYYEHDAENYADNDFVYGGENNPDDFFVKKRL